MAAAPMRATELTGGAPGPSDEGEEGVGSVVAMPQPQQQHASGSRAAAGEDLDTEEESSDTVSLLGTSAQHTHKLADEADGNGDEDHGYTFDEAVEAIGFGRFHWKLVVLCGVGYFAEITELVVVSFVAPAIQVDFGLAAWQYGLLGSSSFIGMAAGALFWGFISDNYGRQLSFSLTVWVTFFGGFLSAFAPNYIIILILRFTAAFGIGGMLPVDYTVFLEFLPSHRRGSRIVLVDAIGVVPALFLSALIAFLFSGSGQIKWRWVLGIVAIPVGIMAILRRHVPESPRYHLANGDVAKAQEIVEAVAKENKASLPPGKLLPLYQPSDLGTTTENDEAEALDGELQSLSQTHEAEAEVEGEGEGALQSEDASASQCVQKPSSSHLRIGELFEGSILKQTTPRLWLLWFVTQFSAAGIGFALPKLFKESFDVSEKQIALDLLWGVFGLLPALALAYFVVEKSRKLSLAGFLAGGAVSVLWILVVMVGPPGMQNQAMAIVASLFVRGTVEGCFALLNTATVEAYPTAVRASGMGTAQIFDHIAGATSPLFFSVFDKDPKLRPVALAVYAGAFLIGVVPAVTLPRDYAGKPVTDVTKA